MQRSDESNSINSTMAVILSVSVSKEQSDFIEEMQLKPSKMLQSAVDSEMERSRISAGQLKEANEKIKRLLDTLDKQRNFIENKGLMDEFVKML